jgi:hypothetical protein
MAMARRAAFLGVFLLFSLTLVFAAGEGLVRWHSVGEALADSLVPLVTPQKTERASIQTK